MVVSLKIQSEKNKAPCEPQEKIRECDREIAIK
jgi:hypothetical protein